jgi:hypothetical protein
VMIVHDWIWARHDDGVASREQYLELRSGSTDGNKPSPCSIGALMMVVGRACPSRSGRFWPRLAGRPGCTGVCGRQFVVRRKWFTWTLYALVVVYATSMSHRSHAFFATDVA